MTRRPTCWSTGGRRRGTERASKSTTSSSAAASGLSATRRSSSTSSNAGSRAVLLVQEADRRTSLAARRARGKSKAREVGPAQAVVLVLVDDVEPLEHLDLRRAA